MKTQFNRLFEKILYNENIVLSESGANEKKAKYFFMFMFLTIFIFLLPLKWILNISKFNDEETKELGISWNKLHKEKILIFKKELAVLNIDYSNQINLFITTKIKISNVFKNVIKCKKTSSVNTLRQFLYAAYISFLYEILKQKLKNTKAIIISGHFDRWVMILEELSNQGNIKMSIVQHGCFQIFSRPLLKIRLTGDFYYTYNFSLNTIDSYYLFNNNGEKKPLKRHKKIKMFDNKEEGQTIVFGCQDVNPRNNHLIIQYLKRNFSGVKIYILPHPRENDKSYKGYLSNNTVVTREKPKNINVFLSRYSTLGIEYLNTGAKVLFINIDEVKMDFLEEYSHYTCTNLDDLKYYLGGFLNYDFEMHKTTTI